VEAALPTASGGALAAGAGVGGRAQLVRVGASGKVEWTRSYPEGSVFRAVVPAADGGYALAGSGAGRLLLARTDADGNLRWARTYGEGGSDAGAHAVLAAEGGGYVVVGTSGSGRSTRIRVVRTDAEGVALWSREVGGS
jgi:hypothetical protein